MSEPQTAPATAPADPAPRPVPSLREMAWAYFMIGATGFGGAMPWLRRTLVEQRRWLTPDEFNDALAFSQFLPGPLAFNLIVVVGRRFHGARGILVSTVAIMVAPMFYSCAVGALYARFGDLPVVQDAMRGVAPVAAGLMLTFGIKTAAARSLRSTLAIVVAVTFVLVVWFRLGLFVVLLSVIPLSLILSARRIP